MDFPKKGSRGMVTVTYMLQVTQAVTVVTVQSQDLADSDLDRPYNIGIYILVYLKPTALESYLSTSTCPRLLLRTYFSPLVNVTSNVRNLRNC